MKPLLGDAALKVTKALPSGAASTTTDAIDLGDASGDFRADCELLIQAPAMGVTPMADAKTMTYQVLGSVNSDLSSPFILADKIIVQTGAGGVGCAAAEGRWKPPSNAPRYIGVKATGSTTGDASGSSVVAKLVF
jgi:hypothetical protein